VSESDDSGDRLQGPRNEVRSLRTSLDQSDRLLQELRIHQIELEIQNRALAEAQEQLEASRERYVDLFDFAPIPYLILEMDGRIVEANIAAAEMIGHDRSAIVGRRLQTLVGITDPLAFRAVVRQTAETKRECRAEVTFRTASQQAYTVDMQTSPVAPASPVAPGGSHGLVRIALHDLTSRVAAEQALRFLSQAGVRLNRIPLGSPELLDEIAAAGAFGTVDGCWVELDGKESVAWRSDPVRRKMIGASLQALRLQITRSIREARDSGRAAFGRWSLEIEVGSSSPVLQTWVTAPLREGGSIHGTVTLFQRVTPEAKEGVSALADEFARSVSTILENTSLFRRAEEATRSRDEMMSILAHDLSNALFSFRLHSQRGLARGGEHAQRALAIVARGSQWLLGLVKTVLDVAEIGSGILKLQRRPGNLSDVLESACLLHQMDAEERRVQLVRAWPPEVLLEFDQERILQVFFNLMNNAVKFTPKGGRIEIGASREDEQVRVWVRDSGTGLDPGQLERVFERGWQQDPKRGGKGLGLYISRRIVEAHGGTMWAESTRGHGATFHVVLPLGVPAAASPENQAPVSP